MRAPISPTDYARGYDVLVSTNDISWTIVAACTGTANPEIVSFPTQTAQWVRVVLTAASTTDWWSIDEFDLYSSAPAPTTTTTSTTTHHYDAHASALPPRHFLPRPTRARWASPSPTPSRWSPCRTVARSTSMTTGHP